MRINIFLLAGATAFLASCTVSNKPTTSAPEQAQSFSEENKGQSVDFSYMDLNANPEDDFYQYANGVWVAENPVPESETKWSSFNELEKNNNAALKEILEEAASQKHEPGTVDQLIGDYYFTFMDSMSRNKNGIQPVAIWLEKVDQITSKDELASVIAELHNYGFPVFFGAGVEQDLKNNTRHMVYMGQGGMGLPEKGYYTKTDEDSKNIQSAYQKLMEAMLKYAGGDKEMITRLPEVYDLESNFASASMSQVELRNYFAQYNVYSKKDFKDLAPSLKWDTYFSIRGYRLDTLIVMQPEFFRQLETQITANELQTLKAYMKWHIMNGSANILSDEIESHHFTFYSTKLKGQKTMQPRWKRAIQSFGRGGFSEVLGHAFVNKNFSEEAKQKVNEMVDNIMLVYRERIENLDWMTDETKKQAIHKLDNFTRKLGYPDKWTDFSGLKLRRTTYAENSLAINAWTIKKNTEKLYKGIDRDEWGMAPHIVNAYYNPLLNEIVFPAGIMQPPFFDPGKEDAVNYARMGAVIGHELTHGFDDQGAQFTAEGEFKNWWTEEDQLQFAARTKKLVNQFNAFEALPGLNVNGQLTLGENIADFGGLTIAYHAYMKSLEGKPRTTINGFSNEQRFFIAFAQIWKSNYTKDAMKLQVNTNPHSPGKFRVIGTLSNMPEFFAAFDVAEKDRMRQPEDKIAVIW